MLRPYWTSCFGANFFGKNGVAIAVIAGVLTGCGGGGGSDSSNTPNTPTSFTVGGSVTGLSGSVVLRLNGASDLTVTGSNTFTFNTQLANNTVYTVTVATLPSTQVCNVTAGNTGTIANANVTNVAIACSNYGIGGAVSGLTKAGLVLQVNGANDLAVPAASSTFAFPAATSLNSPFYTVRIKSQPAGQTCTIVKSTGFLTIAAANISGATGPAVACMDNATDSFSGTYRLQVDGFAGRAYVTFDPDGTYTFGVHSDDASCGANNGNGVMYGVYNWKQSTQTLTIVNHAIDTTNDCGLDSGSTSVLTVDEDGALALILTDSSGPHENGKLVPVTSTAGTLIGSWSDNQSFAVFSSDNKFFFASSKSIVQNSAASPGLEDGCYAFTGTTSSGSITFDLSASCSVGGTQKAVDTSGPVGFSGVGRAVDFTVTGDSMQASAGPVTPLNGTAARVKPTSIPSTYSISAAINGLSANGLVLQTNGGNSVAVNSGATTSTLATGLVSGRTYAVAVQSQPTGQTCAVTNGSGIAFANVTNVAVNCANVGSTTYTVGGGIAGLTGAGLALRLNDQSGAAFNVNASGNTYVFGAGLQTGTAYTVAIAAQPTSPTQFCFVSANAVGVIGAGNVSNASVNCINSNPYKVGGSVSGLTGAGLSLRMTYVDTYTGTSSAPVTLGVTANATTFNFSDTIPANGFYDIGIAAQPAGQTCTIVKARAIQFANSSTVGISCVSNATDPLSGTYTLLNEQGRQYINFNANGTYTTALIHNDWKCNTGTDLRNGNGVEYGVFNWTQSTGAMRFPNAAAVDTNGDCGFNDNGGFNLTRVGSAVEIRDTAGGPIVATAQAVESVPSSLVGAFTREAGNGSLLVFHSDGTFLFVDTQLLGLSPLLYGQERGCYSVSGSTVTLTLAPPCRPDNFAPYDMNAFGGLFPVGIATAGPFAFTINDADTITFGSIVWKRTKPN